MINQFLSFSTVSGGLSAELTGGNFWQGAAIGLAVSALNHGMHRSFVKKPLPSYSELESNYPGYDEYSTEELYEMLGGKLKQNYDSNPDAFANTCTVRISVPMNETGELIPYHKGQTISSASKKWYFYRTLDFKKYLQNNYSNSSIELKGTPLDNYNQIKGQTGIIFFRISYSDASGHFTLFNGVNVLGGGHDTSYYFNNASSITFWNVK